MWLQKQRRARQCRSAQSFPAPSLVSLGTVAGDTTWRAVAPIAVDDWQFCTNDGAFDPGVKTFDQWVDGADAPDTAFVNVDAKTATVTVDFGWCAARYLVGTTWSSWTGVVYKDAIALPPLPTGPDYLSAAGGGNGIVIVDWDMLDVTNADGFSIERKFGWEDDSAFTVRGSTGGMENTFTDNVDEHMVVVVYRVRSYNVAGYSAYSNSAPVFIP